MKSYKNIEHLGLKFDLYLFRIFSVTFQIQNWIELLNAILDKG